MTRHRCRLILILSGFLITSAAGVPGWAGEEGDSADGREPIHNTLRWTTASEVNNFGFDIYRGEAEDGPFERITERPIPGAGTTDEPSDYVYEDFGIEAGVTYYYYVESISTDGVRERFSPVFAAPPKYPEE